MQPSDYLDVELQVIGRDRARLICPDRQEYVDSVQLDGALGARLLELEHAKDYQGYGRALFAATFPVGTGLQRGIYSVLDSSRKDGRRIRLRLNLDAAAAEGLQGWHWELISDGEDFEPARSPEILFSRYVSQPFAIGPAPGKPRLLCVIAAPTDAHRCHMAPIDYDLTSRHLKECFAKLAGQLEVDFLERPTTPDRLRAALRGGKYHLLHVHGHGTIPTEGEAALVLEDAEHKARFTTETELRSILLGLSELKLVTLVACHGGEASVKEDQLSGLAGALVRRNVPAVIAMRRAISMSVGLRFTSYLYQQLAESPCVDAAMNEARHRLYMDNRKGIDWSSPALFMRLQDGLLWSPPPPPPPASPDEPTKKTFGGRRQIAVLTLVIAGILLLSLRNTYNGWPISNASIDLDQGSVVPPPPPPPSGPTTARVDPPKIEIKPIVTGSVGVGAVDGRSLAWKGEIARMLVPHLRTLRPGWKPVVIPEALRSKLGAFLEGDLSSLPGGDKAPYGFEYIFLAAETHGDNPNKILNFPTVSVSCEMSLIATRNPEVRSSESFDHTGQAGTEAGALEQAFGRCVESSLGEPPQ